MASLFEYEKEAIRIKAKRVDKEEYRKFSIDPNITSFEILQSILCRAFELTQSDIGITYRIVEKNGAETWTPLLSDWDLDTAILASPEPGLFLHIKVMEPCGSLGELSRGDITSPVIEAGQSLVKELEPVQRSITEAAATAKAVGVNQVSVAGAGLQGLMSRSGQKINEMAKSGQASGFFKRHVEQTLPGLARQMRTALSINQEEELNLPPRPPVSDQEFRSFLNKVGQVVAPREMRLAVYRGGLESGIRKVAWKHLLNLYPAGLTGGERLAYLGEKSELYRELKRNWMDLVLQGRITDDVKTVMNMVRKDVLRTDRQIPFYAGEGNANVTTLFNILTTYALNHPSDSYCQGMSDLASPILVIMGEEAHAYMCFCALMSRMTPNFLLDGNAMTTKFQHLSEGLMYYDPEFYTYLKMHQADDLLFCYRWLLLEMKREFAFDFALKALEVTWSSLPPATADTEVKLWEVRFSPKLSPSSVDLSKPCETAYGKVVSLRKMSLDRRNTSEPGDIAKDSRGRIRSDNTNQGQKGGNGQLFKKSHSVANVNLRKRKDSSSKNGSIDDDEKISANDKKLPSPVKDSQKISPRSSPTKTPVAGKKLVNLNDFYALTNTTEDEITTEKKTIKDPEPAPDNIAKNETKNAQNKIPEEVTSPCQEVAKSPANDDPFDFVGYSQANAALTVYCNRLPPPTVFGDGNPFLMFLCLSCLLQHREHIMTHDLDYQDIAMYFDRLVRGHHVDKVLNHARRMFAEYLNEDWTPSPQPGPQTQAHNC